MAKKPKNAKKTLAVTAGCAAGIVLLFGAATIAANVYGEILDKYLPQGEMHTKVVPGSENWDANYYTNDFGKDAAKTDDFAKNTTKEIAGEGITLLKNDGVLPLKTGKTGGTTKKVTLLGRRSVDTVWGGSGSGAGDAAQCTHIGEALKNAGFEINETVTKMYSDHLAEVPKNSGGMDQPTNTTSLIGEFPSSYYTSEITNTYSQYNDAAIVVIGREGGEGLDLETDMKGSIGRADYGNPSNAETANYVEGQHQLELTKEEKNLIAHAKENFGKVVVVINSCNVMELKGLDSDSGINGIVWMGYPGSRGCVALAEILNGTINPSGHTVDIWPADLTADPTFNNTNVLKYSNINSENAMGDAYTIEYEEGIYIGYRYYETKDAVGGHFKVESNTNASYDDAVAYPFGYGLSYTTFEQTLTDVSIDSNDVVHAKVSVHNTGSVPGKDVVQVYYSAPYTAGGVEKSAVVLGGFAKTDILAADETKEYEVTWQKDMMASYDYKIKKCYVLDAGEYVFSARKNSHVAYGASKSLDIAGEVYDASNPRKSEIKAQKDNVNYSKGYLDAITVQAATNKFDDVSSHFKEYTESGLGAKNMTRADFDASFPTKMTAQELIASEDVIKGFKAYQPDYYNSEDKTPTTGVAGNIKAGELRGIEYDDPRWDAVLDQLTAKDMRDFIMSGNQGTVTISKISLPSTKATDGPAGLKQYGGLGFGASGNFNCANAIVAATWNVKLAKQYGIAVGNEAVIAGVSGWYAPGNDIHRSAFGGRNFEYYSEDPVLAGNMMAGTIEGTAEKGLVCYTKHFAFNEMERHRTEHGPAVWVNEQAAREIYLRAFEIGIVEPTVELKHLDNQGNSITKTMRAATGMMSSFTRIGTTWCGGSEALLNGVLRGEWGFMGSVVTDYNGSDYMFVEEGVRAGNDLMLANIQTIPTTIKDSKNPSTLKVMRQAMKNNLYAIVNSVAMNGICSATTVYYDMAPWRIILISADTVAGVAAAGLIALGVVTFLKAKKAGTKEEQI